MQLQNSEHIVCCYSWAGRNADPSPDKQAVLLWAAEGAEQSATQIKIGSCQFPIYHSACRFLPLRKSLGSPKPLMTIISCLSKSSNVEWWYDLDTWSGYNFYDGLHKVVVFLLLLFISLLSNCSFEFFPIMLLLFQFLWSSCHHRQFNVNSINGWVRSRRTE